MNYKVTNGESTDFVYLSSLLDGLLNKIAGGSENRAEYIPHNKTSDLIYSVVAYDGDNPVGCAGLKPFDADSIEVKRVYVKDEYRNRGIAKNLLNMLEQKAKALEYKRLILETGEPLSNSILLYKSAGYTIIKNYGPYKHMSDSICFGKNI